MRKLITLVLLLGLMAPVSYAALNTAEEKYVRAVISIKDLKKQIQVKEIERVDAINAARAPYDTDIATLTAQLKTAAESIGLDLDDVEN